jgi:hypothetical protein
VFIGSDTTGGGGIGLISNADTSYVYATGDCLTILADTIRLDGYLDLPASISFDSTTIGTATYPRTTTGANNNNTGAIYRDSSNVLQVDRCLPWTCNDSGDVILTDTTDWVGIGTSTPSAALHVVGGVIVDNDTLVVKGSDELANFKIHVDGFLGTIGDVDNEVDFELRGAVWTAQSNFVLGGGGTEAGQYETLIDASNGGQLQILDGNQSDGYVLTSDAVGNATWQDHTAWGEMGFGDSTSTQALTQNVWHVITNPNEDLWSESVVDTHAVTYTNDSIVIQKNGTYALNVQLSVDGSASSIIRLGIYVNGSLACTCTGYQQLSNNEIVQINYINIDELSEGDVIQPVITNTANNNDVDAIAGKLTIHKID